MANQPTPLTYPATNGRPLVSLNQVVFGGCFPFFFCFPKELESCRPRQRRELQAGELFCAKKEVRQRRRGRVGGEFFGYFS